MKAVLVSTPATGHLNPLLSIGKILADGGHEVIGLSSHAMQERIEDIARRSMLSPRRPTSTFARSKQYFRSWRPCLQVRT